MLYAWLCVLIFVSLYTCRLSPCTRICRGSMCIQIKILPLPLPLVCLAYDLAIQFINQILPSDFVFLQRECYHIKRTKYRIYCISYTWKSDSFQSTNIQDDNNNYIGYFCHTLIFQYFCWYFKTKPID